MRDLSTYLLWSCILRYQFGYGKIPVSSTSCERQIKNIKQYLLNNKTLSMNPMRPDDFVIFNLSEADMCSSTMNAESTVLNKESPKEDCMHENEISNNKIRGMSSFKNVLIHLGI